MPTVSVIIPTHNRAELLCSAIKSVVNQTYRDLEIIVVDDASNDNTREIVSGLCDNRIKYFRHDNNRGDAGSRNTGVVNSSGMYLAFLDDDDEWLPEKLQMQVELLRNSSATTAGVYTGSLTVEWRSQKIVGVNIAKTNNDAFREIFLDNFIATSSVLLKRECFEVVGLFDERIPYNSDYDMWIRIARQFCFECIREPLFIYHIHEKKLNTNLKLVLQGHEIILKKYDQMFLANAQNLSRIYCTLGILYSLNGNVDESRKALFKAIRSSPFTTKQYLVLVASLTHACAVKNLIKLNEKICSPLRERRLRKQLNSLASGSSLKTVRAICRAGALKLPLPAVSA